MELSKSQLNYILAIKQLAGGKVTQKYICEYLGVTKPSASNALKNLEELGYISKEGQKAGNNYILTDKSRKILDLIEQEKFEFMSLFFRTMKIDENLCQEQYNSLCGMFNREFIENLIELRENNYNINKNSMLKLSNSMGIENGVYEIPFQVIQADDTSRSMGDKGFEHPAKLICGEEVNYISLTPKEIYYKSKNEQVLRGRLQKLDYFDVNLNWITAENDENGNIIIPLENILYQKDCFGKINIGIIKIRATASTIKMPVSVAEITFNFKLIKKVENGY